MNLLDFLIGMAIGFMLFFACRVLGKKAFNWLMIKLVERSKKP